MNRRSLAFLAAVMILTAVRGQQQAQEPDEANFRVDAALAVIPVSVVNAAGEPVAGLTRKHFRLFVDGVEQKIAFLSTEDRPVSVCLAFDLSSSMRTKMPVASAAVVDLLHSFQEAGDEFCLILFNEHPRLAVPFTANPEDIGIKLRRAKPLGRTALLDALHLARTEMRKARNVRKVIVMISDGGDNHSRFTRAEVRKEMEESGAQVYAMSVSPAAGPNGPTATEERNGPVLLDEIARASGGRHVELTQVKDLPATCSEIARKLHNEYLLGFSPLVRDGQSHRIEIQAIDGRGAPYTVFHRTELLIPAH